MEDITLADFWTYYIAMTIKTVGYWHGDRHVHQWNRMENPIAHHLNMTNGFSTNIQRQFHGRRIFFSTCGTGTTPKS